jgi:hypothetical protein
MRYQENSQGEMVPTYTIKEIFADNWDDFTEAMSNQNKDIRKVIMREVDKIIQCQDIKKGFALYSCPNCHNLKFVLFTCKSRFCNCCGAKYSKDRALNMSSKLIDCSHRHVVFTIPEELRKYFACDRSLLNLLFKAAEETVNYYFNRRSKTEKYTPGMIMVLHTFGRDLKWNPHIHMILCEEAVGTSNRWHQFNHIHYEAFRRGWQFSILKLLSEKIKDSSFKSLVNNLYATYKQGFYVNAPPIKKFSFGAIDYILRYAGRPVIAQSRITKYDGETVTFNYTPHDSNELITETVPVFDFIKRLIIHIPDENFKMIRYSGFYFNFNTKYKQYLLRAKKMPLSTYTQLKQIHKSWRSRIRYYFRYDTLKCPCGSYYELIELFCSPRKINFYLSYYYHDSS